MVEKEVAEIRRTLRPGRTTVPSVYGCYVNASGTVIAKFERPLDSAGEEESEKYLSLFRKTLSGTLHKNLLNMSFGTAEVDSGERHRRLMTLRDSGLSDEAARDALFGAIAGSVKSEENYLILLASGRYDVPVHGKSDSPDSENLSDEVFSFLSCAICPVKPTASALAYDPAARDFRQICGENTVAAPEAGFLFPAFDDRQSNIYGALFYTRNAADAREELTDALFGSKIEMTAPAQGDAFREVLAGALAEDCSLPVVQALRARIAEVVEKHKENHVRQSLTVSLPEVASYLSDSGVSDEKLAAFGEMGDEKFGKCAELYPKNIIEPKKFELRTPDVVVKATPEGAAKIETRVIGGHKYILIDAEAGVELNGLNLSFPEEKA